MKLIMCEKGFNLVVVNVLVYSGRYVIKIDKGGNNV